LDSWFEIGLRFEGGELALGAESPCLSSEFGFRDRQTPDPASQTWGLLQETPAVKAKAPPMPTDFLLAGPGLYRGPQPRVEDLQTLKSRGLRSVVNLREESDESRYYCRHLELSYHGIPVVDWTVPEVAQVEEFLDLMEHPPNRPLLIHCWGGVGRTGLFVSCWRIRMGMETEEAIRLSDMETPHQGMNQIQRDWIRRFRPEPR
jgi:protein tyrosine phosphatase (PTP) superfamily phosphohydrolase (DUF442 family)